MSVHSDAEFVGLQSILRERYSLERRIGRGGMGEVFLARDLALDRAVAIKLLPLAYAGDARARERFLKEARTAAKLSHPHIVPIHSVEEHGDFVFFAMAYVDGETLADRVRRGGPLGAPDAARILKEVAWALAYAHRIGVVHRDIKPENILLEHGTARALVSDFGIARVRGAATGNQSREEILGTVQYMSPEQIQGTQLDGRSDLYSLGVTIFHALTTRLPYPVTTSPAGEQLTPPTPPIALLRPDLPRALAEAVDMCLAPDPRNRFANGEELAAHVGESQAGGGDAPMVLKRYARGVRALGQELMTALAAILANIITVIEAYDIGHPIATPLAAFTPTLGTMAMSLVLLRFVRVVLRSRDVLAASLRFEDARAVLPGGTQSLLDSAHGLEGPSIRRIAGTVLLVVTVAVVWHFAFRAVMRPANSFGWYVAVGLVVAMLIIVLRRILANVIFRPDAPGLWNGIWRGGFGRLVFDVASLRLSRSRIAGSARAPERVLASAIRMLVKEMEPAMQKRLESILRCVREMVDECAELRARGRRLDKLLRDTAMASDIKPNTQLADQRRGVVDELNEARGVIDSQLATLIGQMESIRLELLRLRAGLGSVDSIVKSLDELERQSGEFAAALRIAS